MPADGNSHKKKRVSKESDQTEDSTTWECSMCTFRNKNEAFKCEMCDTRKGTSTRKPKLNENVVERQKTMHNFVVQQQEKAVNRFSTFSNSNEVPLSFRKRTQQSLSPTNSRHSPVSSCSSNRSMQTKPRAKRAMVPIPDSFVYRTSPKKIVVTVNGEVASITEYRRKPAAADRVGPRKIHIPTSSS